MDGPRPLRGNDAFLTTMMALTGRLTMAVFLSLMG